MDWHPNADDWQFDLSGRARVTIFGAHGRTKIAEFGPGQVAFIKQGFGHFVEQLARIVHHLYGRKLYGINGSLS
jgi:oxalate decarboxylase